MLVVVVVVDEVEEVEEGAVVEGVVVEAVVEVTEFKLFCVLSSPLPVVEGVVIVVDEVVAVDDAHSPILVRIIEMDTWIMRGG